MFQQNLAPLGSLTVSALVALVLVGPAVAQPTSVFKEGKHGAGELKFVSGIPVLTVSGKPAEIGEQLGVLAGVTRQTISSIETGQYNPSALLALLLARRLDKRVEDLFYLEEEKS